MAASKNTTRRKPTAAKRKTSTSRTRKPAPKKPTIKKPMSPLMYEIVGLIIIAIAIITFFKFGIVGEFLQSATKLFFGSWFILIPLLMCAYAGYMMIVRALPEFKNRFVWGTTLFVIGATLFSQISLFKFDAKQSVLAQTWTLLITEQNITTPDAPLGGGLLGGVVFATFHFLFDTTGATIAAWLMMLIAVILITGRAFVPYIMQQLPSWKESIASRRKEVREARQYRKAVKKQLDESKKQPKKETAKKESVKKPKLTVLDGKAPAPTAEMLMEEEMAETPKRELNISAFTQNIKEEPQAKQEEQMTIEEMETNDASTPILEGLTDEQTQEKQAPYQLPEIELLTKPTPTDQSGEFDIIQENATKLEQTFQSFGVKATVTEVHIGPAVTEYEVLPDRGVKVSKIVNLQDDLALALAAKDIRIEAPIPGKSAVGIEVPNKEVAIVSLREVLESKENNKPDAKLLIGLGRDISGEAKLAQLQKMPHLLVAG
ncbi:MAG: DNA translocase FtsK, partial [Kurthia sp.]